MEFTGRIMRLLPIRSGVKADGTTWKSQEFIFEYFERDTDRYSDKVVLTIMNDRITDYDLHEGDEVTIGFSHNVDDYQGRFYNRLRVYRVKKLTQAIPTEDTPAQEPAPAKEEKAEAPQPQKQEDTDDLPF